jgi:phage shock protein PspC (stress-responsive transcriptional regulator)
MQTKRLTRSNSNRMLGGVCGGLAEYFNIDPTLVRLAFVILTFLPGPSFIVYLVLWVIMPPAAGSVYVEKPKNDQQF